MSRAALAPLAPAAGAGAKPGKTVEQVYQKKTQLEHILLRPDSYVGSIAPQVRGAALSFRARRTQRARLKARAGVARR